MNLQPANPERVIGERYLIDGHRSARSVWPTKDAYAAIFRIRHQPRAKIAIYAAHGRQLVYINSLLYHELDLWQKTDFTNYTFGIHTNRGEYCWLSEAINRPPIRRPAHPLLLAICDDLRNALASKGDNFAGAYDEVSSLIEQLKLLGNGTDIVIHNNRRYRRVVREQQLYRSGVLLGLVTLHGREYVVRLQMPGTWIVIAPAGRSQA